MFYHLPDPLEPNLPSIQRGGFTWSERCPLSTLKTTLSCSHLAGKQQRPYEELDLGIFSYVSIVVYTLYWAFVEKLLVHGFTVVNVLWNFVEILNLHEVNSGPWEG